MCLAISAQFLLLSSLFLLIITNCFPLQCHEDERHALLQFKEGFVINKSASVYPFSHPKISSWIAHTNCCSWDGIQCDESTGNVIGIDLSSSQLYGSVDPNSTLFSLVHLQRLDLTDNDFNHSQIPSRIGELSKLRYLNLSHANFLGEIPQQVSRLSKLLSLDLISTDCSPNVVNSLNLKISTLRSLIQNSTHLETLRLVCVTISSSVPNILANLTSLQNLALFQCELYGEFPAGIFHLPNLRSVDLGHNQYLTGKFPDFSSNPPISMLRLTSTGFYGTLPSSIGNLKSLNLLSISACNFSGASPSSLGNLTQLTVLDIAYNKLKGDLSSSLVNLTKLQVLRVGFNEFTVENMSWICKLSRINYLDLGMTNIGSKIPSCFANLTQLYVLGLGYTNISGQIPPWIMNMTHLALMDLGNNNLQGEIPNSLFKLENLDILFMSNNLLEGELELDKFLGLKKLTFVDLSFNKLSLIGGKNPFNASLSRIQVLRLSSCNLVEVPNFLRDLSELEYLYISNNNVNILPSWMWEKINLQGLVLSNNSLIGEISPLICNLKFLVHLELSFNNLSGTVPSCLGSFSQSLKVLMLQGNKLIGSIPQTYMIRSSLRMIDFSNNNLQGQLPRALVNCKMLEYIDLSYNHINDSFPFWLGTLPEVKVVVLRKNQLYGSIGCPTTCSFPKLHIIDLSHNEFSGRLVPEIIQNWKSMKAANMSQLQYEDPTHIITGKLEWCPECEGYSFTMPNKGMVLVYKRLQQFYNLISIDLSSNKISGEIPEVMGELTGLVSLNLSNNLFTGSIPSSIGKLSGLESLDLSFNNLSGEIPQQLTQLTFLSVFNVSFNNLSGPIPQSKQFSTFSDNSFEGNQGLCGDQLLNKCEDHSRSDSVNDQDLGSFLQFDWKVTMIGYGGGLVVGVALGSTFSPEIFAWLKRIRGV